jgi:4-amino-4-deoxy-L-arabinose transferase-like glycosyltransferase
LTDSLAHPIPDYVTPETPHPFAASLRRISRAQMRMYTLALLLLAVLQFCVLLEEKPLTNTFEGRVALTSREMLQRGDWMVPHLAGKPRLQKPPLPYWTTAGLWSLARREQLWLLRLPVAVMGAAGILLMIDLGSMTLGRLGGLICGVIWISSYYIVDEYRKAMADPYLAFFTLLCVWAWIAADRTKSRGHGCWRRRLLILVAYLALGLGALAKGQMILVHAAMALAPYHLILRRRVRGGWTHLLGIALMLAIALPWPIYIYRHVPDAL